MTEAAVPDHVIELDVERSVHTVRDGGHNRWHCDIPPLVRMNPGEVLQADVRDASDAQVFLSEEIDVMAATDLDLIHPLTGPVYINGAQPGDLLEVEIMEIEVDTKGWSSVFHGGGGLMEEHVAEDAGFIWERRGDIITSQDLPGVEVKSRPFLGVIGVAPSEESRREILRQEERVRAAGGSVMPPSPRFAYPDDEFVVRDGLRTNPARPLGGNLDTRDLTAGSRFFIRVDVPGALLSFGDMHMAQGDGESFGTAIETSGTVTLRCHLHKSEALPWVPEYPVLQIDGPVEGRYASTSIICYGMAYDADGNISPKDTNLATQNALLALARYLSAVRGLNDAQAKTVISVAGDLRIPVIVNPPTPVVSASLELTTVSRDARHILP